jgi:hypothetical protein
MKFMGRFFSCRLASRSSKPESTYRSSQPTRRLAARASASVEFSVNVAHIPAARRVTVRAKTRICLVGHFVVFPYFPRANFGFLKGIATPHLAK